VESKRATRLGRFVSLVLRHKPEAAGVSLDREGWADVGALLAGAAREGVPFSRDELDELVATNDKQRFALSEDGRRIRARQGHSLTVELGLSPSRPPAALFHGTVERFVHSILQSGLEKRARQYVHLSTDIPTAQRVGRRRGTPVVLRIAADRMAAAGHQFFLAENGVWLTESVPVAFIERIETE
jgi:putative RNA 2'-phosphotransferase